MLQTSQLPNYNGEELARGLLVQPRKKPAETSFIIPVGTASSCVWGSTADSDQTGEAQL